MTFSIEKEAYSKITDVYKVYKDKEPLTFFSFAQDLESDTNSELQALIFDCLKESQFTAYFWEFISVKPTEAKQTAVSFAITKSKGLEKVVQNSKPFKKHIKKAREVNENVSVFNSLGGDAELIIPVASANDEMVGYYAHIAAFARHGKEQEQFSLLKMLGKKLLDRFNDEEMANKPLWTSTSGLGVYYLHLRLDSRPKYYVHKPFK